MIAKIHIAKQQLGMDDASYRAMLQRISDGRTTSSTTMRVLELELVLKEMAAKGFHPRPARAKKSRPRPARDRAALISKVTALLADARRPDEYADRMAQHMFHVDAWRFLTPDQLWRLVAALQIDANRRNAGAK